MAAKTKAESPFTFYMYNTLYMHVYVSLVADVHNYVDLTIHTQI